MSERFNKSNNFGRNNKILTSEWEMVTKNNDGEPEVTKLHKYEYQGDLETVKEFIVPPEKELKYRKRKIGKSILKSCETFFIFSDSHIGFRNVDGESIPTHDPRAMKIAQEIAYDIQPDYVVNLGDTLDFAELSRWDADSTHFLGMTQKAIDTAYDFEKGMREATPNARYVELEGNHTRINRLLAKSALNLMGLKQAGRIKDAESLFSYEHLMNLGSLDIDYISGYPEANFMPYEDIQFRHGSDLRSNGSTAELLSKRYPYHGVIQGHGHKSQTHWKTLPNGHQQPYHMTPILGRTDGVIPSYGSAVNDHNKPVHKQEDWQTGVSIYQRYPNGISEIRSIQIKDGEAYLDSRQYKATEEDNKE